MRPGCIDGNGYSGAPDPVDAFIVFRRRVLCRKRFAFARAKSVGSPRKLCFIDGCIAIGSTYPFGHASMVKRLVSSGGVLIVCHAP